jgi:hypothetical protein
MGLAAFSRAIECRDPAVDDRLSALKTVARMTGRGAGFRGQHPGCRGLEPWNAAITHGLRGSCSLRFFVNAAKINSNQEIRLLIGGDCLHFFCSGLRYAAIRLKTAISMQTCRLKLWQEILPLIFFHCFLLLGAFLP